MQRPREVIGYIVGDIDQRRDGPQTDSPEFILEPFRARAVFHPAYISTHKFGTGQRINIPEAEADPDGAVKFACHRRCIKRLQGAKAACRKIAGNPVNAEGILMIGRDGNFQHRIIQPGDCRKRRADRRFLRQVNNPVMLIGEAHFPLRYQHAVAFHTADLARLKPQVRSRNIGAGGGEDAFHAGAGIGGAADDLHDTFPRINLAHPQAIRIRMLNRLNNMGNREGGQFPRPVGNFFHLKAYGGQPFGQFVKRRVILKMFFQPGNREFHRDNPPPSVGISRGTKP